MMHPLLHLIATQPQLLADHAEAYGDMVAAEASAVAAAWKRRAMLNAVALCCLGVCAVLTGVALMLWAVTAAASIHSGWALIAAPLVPGVAALVCLMAARSPANSEDSGAFSKVKQQVRADLAMLREMSAA